MRNEESSSESRVKADDKCRQLRTKRVDDRHSGELSLESLLRFSNIAADLQRYCTDAAPKPLSRESMPRLSKITPFRSSTEEESSPDS